MVVCACVCVFRFDLNIEPIFAVMALYDAREKRKISESFHLDCNPSDITHMLDDHVEERSMASLSRSAIFNISYPSADVFLIVKVCVCVSVCVHVCVCISVCKQCNKKGVGKS